MNHKGEIPTLKTRLEYEIQSLSALQNAINTLKTKIPQPIIVKKDPEGSSLHLSIEHRDLQLQIVPQLREDLTETYQIEVVILTEELEQLFREIFGPPKKVTRIMPTILDFAKAVLKSSKKTWESDVSRELSLNERELERLKLALMDAASMKGAPTSIIEAARRLSI